MIYLIMLHAYAFPNNVEHLQDIANYFNDKPFLSCTFNGYLVDCAKMKQLQEKQKLLRKKVDPNLMKP